MQYARYVDDRCMPDMFRDYSRDSEKVERSPSSRYSIASENVWMLFRLAEASLLQACDRLYAFDTGTGQHDLQLGLLIRARYRNLTQGTNHKDYGVSAVTNSTFRTLKGEKIESTVNDNYSLHRPPEAAQAAGVVCVPEA